MKKTTFQFLLLGSLALFLNSCDSSKTDSKDKTTDNPTDTQDTDKKEISLTTYSDEEKAFLQSLETPAEKDAPNSEEQEPNKEEVFHGVIFKAHLNDYFSPKELSEINKFKKKYTELLNSPTFLLNTQKNQLCYLNSRDIDNNYAFSKDLAKKIKKAQCHPFKEIYYIPGNNLISINYLDNDYTPKDWADSFLINQKNLLSQKVFKDLTTPYFYYELMINFKSPNNKLQAPPSYKDLIEIGQKFITKYINQKLGNDLLIPYKEVRNTYKKMFSFNPQKDSFYNKGKLIKGGLVSLLQNKNKEKNYDLDIYFPESNTYLSTTTEIPNKNYTLSFALCGAEAMRLQITYNNNKILLYFDIYDVNPNNLLFKEIQSNKPLEEGGVIPKKLLEKMHSYLGHSCKVNL